MTIWWNSKPTFEKRLEMIVPDSDIKCSDNTFKHPDNTVTTLKTQ